MSPTAEYADVFLPINTPWEREALRVGFEGSQAAENLVQLRQAAIDTAGESRSDAFVVFELAKRLGLGHLFWDGNIQAGMNYILEPLGITAEMLRQQPQGINIGSETQYTKYKNAGFKTPTGKIEIFSEVFRDAGYNPLPDFVEPALTPMQGGSAEFPLVLTSAKVVQFCHSQHRDIPSLRKRSPEPELQMHPDTAGERGIESGMMVNLSTHLGSIRMRAKLDAQLDPRVIVAQYGWWAGNQTLGLPALDAFKDDGANINRLISDEYTDPISGSVGHRSYLCDVQPAEVPNDRAWSGWRLFNVTATIFETDDIASFILRPVDGQALPVYMGGQHVNIRIKAPDGQALIRSYSLSSGYDPERYRISVKLAVSEDGRRGQVSGLLHGLEPGSQVELQAPKGNFHLPALAETEAFKRPIVLVAGGIGITPLLSMLYQLKRAPRSGPVRLLYGVRAARDHAFKAEIEALKRVLPTLETITFYGHVTDKDRRDGAFDAEGNITMAALLRDYGQDADFFLCGPPAMVDSITDLLRAEGIQKQRIHLEAFGPSSRLLVLEHNGPQTVHLVDSKKTITWTPGQGSLLDQLEKTGAKLGSGCRTGQCESCIVRLVGGEVVHPEGCATVDSDHCLPCVAVPLTTIELES
jgi:ferredoxin-NADP reductase